MGAHSSRHHAGESARHSSGYGERIPRWVLPVVALSVGFIIVAWAILGMRTPMPSQSIGTCSVDLKTSAGSLTPPAIAVEEKPGETAPEPLYPEQPEIGDHIGTLTLPTLDLSWPIIEGTDDEQLAEGVGHFPGSVLPGIRDNSVLSGHRTTVFGRLGELVEGDPILVETSAGVFSYQITGFEVVSKSSRDVIVPTETAVLTLTTCYPFYSPIPTTEAFIVSAALIDSQLARD